MQLSLICWLLFSCAPFAIISSLETKSSASLTSRDNEGVPTAFSRNKDKSGDEDRNQLGSKVGNIAQSTSDSATKKVRANNNGVEISKVPLKRLLGRQLPQQCPNTSSITCNANAKYRTFDGSCNNLQQPHLGQAGSCHRRILAAEYGDGVSTPRTRIYNVLLPNPREVSIAVHRTPSPDYSNSKYTALFMSYGQFIDHDLTFTPTMTLENNVAFNCCPVGTGNRTACFPIDLGNNDPDFSNNCMNLSRSRECVQCSVRARQQMNSLTAFMDCSQVYGLTDAQANSLRSRVDGKLVTQLIPGVGELLPPNVTNSQCNCPAECCPFRTGDTRANQNMLLTLLHTIFLLFHNLVATTLKSHFPSWADEKLYQESRKFVAACFQNICYNRYLPILLDESDMNFFRLYDMNTRYDCDQDPRTINECMGAAFRLHSTVPDKFLCSAAQQNSAIPLGGNFFNVSRFYMEGNVKCLATGSFRQPQQSFDQLLAPSVNRFLYLRTIGANPTLDLATINIQRGRDHGFPGFTAYVDFCLGIKIRSFDHLANTGLLLPQCLQHYRNLYSSPDGIDLWSALQCENFDNSVALLGPVSRCIVGLQFYGTKYGDRFFWTHSGESVSLTSSQKAIVSNITLERIFCDVLQLKEIPVDVFRVNSQIVSCNSIRQMNLRTWGN